MYLLMHQCQKAHMLFGISNLSHRLEILNRKREKMAKLTCGLMMATSSQKSSSKRKPRKMVLWISPRLKLVLVSTHYHRWNLSKLLMASKNLLLSRVFKILCGLQIETSLFIQPFLGKINIQELVSLKSRQDRLQSRHSIILKALDSFSIPKVII